MPGDQQTQKAHERELTQLRVDVDHLKTVPADVQAIRSDLAKVVSELGQIGELKVQLRVLCEKHNSWASEMKELQKQLIDSRLDRVDLRAKMEAHVDDFNKHREYESKWRREHELSAAALWAKHEAAHDTKDKKLEDGKRRWEDRLWGVFRPGLIGLGGMLVAHVAYDFVRPPKNNSDEFLNLLRSFIHQESREPAHSLDVPLFFDDTTDSPADKTPIRPDKKKGTTPR